MTRLGESSVSSDSLSRRSFANACAVQICRVPVELATEEITRGEGRDLWTAWVVTVVDTVDGVARVGEDVAPAALVVGVAATEDMMKKTRIDGTFLGSGLSVEAQQLFDCERGRRLQSKRSVN